MIRPWKVFLSVAVGAAVLPCSAMAQAPTITITSPGGNSPYAKNATVLAAYSCAGTERGHVRGHRAPTARRSTRRPSARSRSPSTAKNADGATLTTSVVNYQVTENGQPTDPGGSVPATLNLNLGTPTAFTAFVPGIAQGLHVHADGADPVHGRRREAHGRRRERHQRRQDGQRHVRAAADRPGRRAEGRRARPANTLDPTAPAFKPLGGMSAPTELLDLRRPGQRLGRRHLQAGHRRDGRAPHRLLLEDADLHALDDEPVVDSAKRQQKGPAERRALFVCLNDCER